jgi:prevent-host-death family protein
MSQDIWQLQEAKNRFSEVVDKALEEGPQTVTRHGKAVVVILSKDDYNRLQRTQGSLVEFFRASPLVGLDLDLERDQSPPRDIDL